MIVRVQWYPRPSPLGEIPPKLSHVYQCSEYFLEEIGTSNARLILDVNKHDLFLSNGDEAFIMNDQGKTIYVVRTV